MWKFMCVGNVVVKVISMGCFECGNINVCLSLNCGVVWMGVYYVVDVGKGVVKFNMGCGIVWWV